MEQCKQNENVSVNPTTHNRDYNENSIFEATIDGNSIVNFGDLPVIVGCFWEDSLGLRTEIRCKYCKAAECPDFFPCFLDIFEDVKPIYKED